ncbi:MAG: tetratricopeptide repeat protein [Planctomycetota bacterium]|jgi:tetratricopeptide (TPR) repeat protein
MDEQRIFVGRQAELDRFKQVLEDPRGQAIVVVGQAGMGKSWLIDRMALLAEEHPDLKCGYVRYEVTPTDATDATMALMMDNAFEAAQAQAGSFDKTDRRKKQWYALLKTVVPKGSEIAELVQALRRDPQRNTRDQFLERLSLISKRMPANGRALFVIDPEKYMEQRSADSWRLVVRELPERIKFLFAQRPEDELVKSNTFMALPNAVRIPAQRLDVLAETEVDDLVRLRADAVGQAPKVLANVASRYRGHPYAIQAALDIVRKTGSVETLPPDPTPQEIARTQWEQICQNDDAIRLFQAHAILEVSVPDGFAEAVSGIDAIACKRLHSDAYLRGLLRPEGQGNRIYHAILADHILGQIKDEEAAAYHRRAAVFYRAKLQEAAATQTAPDALAATRLPEHVLASEGATASIYAFVNECTDSLGNLGFLDAFISLAQRGLQAAEPGSAEQAVLLGNLGLIYHKRGELDRAEEMHKKSLEIEKRLGRLEGMAGDYANLGLIYQTRGDLDRAEEMLSKALEVHAKLGQREGMANQYANLGLVYQTRGDLDRAEKMHNKALEIEKRLGRLEGMARNYANRGAVCQTRGDLDRAEEMQKKSLEIHEKLGRLEGMAANYANLGLIYQTRGDLDRAERMLKKSLEIHEKLGQLEGIASDYGNLGLIYQTRGDLDRAEEMHNKALEIEEKLGGLEGMANDYGNLGLVYHTRGDLDRAEKMQKKSLEIHEKLGRLEGRRRSACSRRLVCHTW